MKNTDENRKNLDVYIHYIIALCGGLFAVYAMLSRLGNLGQAQTTNIIDIICSILGRNTAEGMLRLIAALLFIGSMILATVLANRTKWDLRYLAIGLDLVAAVMIGFFPLTMNPVIALYPVFFATAFQWCVFKGAKGYVSATIFCTNNLKQTTVSAVEYFLMSKDDPERKEKLQKFKFYGGTFFSFYAGVMSGYLLWRVFGVHSIWFIAVPLFINFVFVFMDNKNTHICLKIQNAKG
ncbi:YoaK family protein [Lacrimispora sp. JR3]|uniref:YoaK family protein n=1 Tax=Lacrimispora sinapis TaxID=3111456 RepID=UPI003749ABC0